MNDTNRRIDEVMFLVRAELIRATSKFGAFNSAHEGYAVLKEEVDELWDDVKANRLDAATKEAVQVAAMAARFVVDGENWRTAPDIATAVKMTGNL